MRLATKKFRTLEEFKIERTLHKYVGYLCKAYFFSFSVANKRFRHKISQYYKFKLHV